MISLEEAEDWFAESFPLAYDIPAREIDQEFRQYAEENFASITKKTRAVRNFLRESVEKTDGDYVEEVFDEAVEEYGLNPETAAYNVGVSASSLVDRGFTYREVSSALRSGIRNSENRPTHRKLTCFFPSGPKTLELAEKGLSDENDSLL
jgi:hypothetical protein